MLIDISSVLLNIIVAIALLWLVVLFIAIVTLSRRRDMATPVKIFWAAIIFFAPVAGLILYFVFGFRKKDHRIKRY
ncbi:hypothetical protein FC093_13435 [Ilyomonas limi]|uniref:Cardiolipin synthase N-terminal domain-containing protein n=1 Tax=Ilyomonas limi TaxID=2575867 RepID=A0A4U3L2K0_9BACT|nr:PLDc N-terminal domain-containing protein [Ilyomonas limi]TKK67747.1 hypothetical protein FC093_13435 [Ilyomonas limi]